MAERSQEAVRNAKDKLDRVVDDLADLEKIGRDYAWTVMYRESKGKR